MIGHRGPVAVGFVTLSSVHPAVQMPRRFRVPRVGRTRGRAPGRAYITYSESAGVRVLYFETLADAVAFVSHPANLRAYACLI